MKLNLGCADRHVEGFVNVDIAPPADQIVDLAGPWPWTDSVADEVLALDVCEHIQDSCQIIGAHTQTRFSEGGSAAESGHAKFRWISGRIHFMNELHRILKPGARAIIETPNAAHGCGFWQDPTHVSGYCLSTFKYFEYGSFAHTRLAKSYGITAAFRIISLTERETPGEDPREKAWKITAIVEAVK